MDPLAKIFGSPGRMKLLRLFLFNDDAAFSFKDAAFRAKLSKALARREMALLLASGIIMRRGGKSVTYQANKRFEHYEPFRIFLRSTTTVKDADLVRIFKKVGNLKVLILSGLFTGAIEPKVDVLIVADRIDERALKGAIHAVEAELGRELRYAAFLTPDFRYRVGVYDRLIRDVRDYPNRVIFDRLGL
ncbi:MAG: hypothetical protein KBC38_01720 [Candidatus Pacebacteria bacterium]|nr:hypothetical protein [Candidatus Paceibacterota bacterium]MBP9840011.1 hypothetical protein [Candidatus Paceibacterota bacterium]